MASDPAMTLHEISRIVGVPLSTLREWIKHEQQKAGSPAKDSRPTLSAPEGARVSIPDGVQPGERGDKED